MGTILAAVGLAVLVADEYTAPWYPGWFILLLALIIITCHELVQLVRQQHAVPFGLVLGGMLLILVANWVPHLLPLLWPGANLSQHPWTWVLGTFAGYQLLVFLREMNSYQGPDNCTSRMALATWMVGYLGLLPSFLFQMRWFPVENHVSTMALVLTIFVPKCCDVGAYFAGRYLGRNKMSPTLSPKKTWEGALGGLTVAALVTMLFDQWGPVPLLQHKWWAELGFGITVGGAGILGDLAESMIKRDCHQKDSSQVVPGFGGVLDVVDAILFASPVAYLWLIAFQPRFPVE
jgi:phosphatidate cytidylyltransferase